MLLRPQEAPVAKDGKSKMWGHNRSARAKPGDIGRVKVDETFWAKLQYLGEHEHLGPTVLVDPNLLNASGELVSGHLLKNYVAFYLFPDFVKDGLVEIVDHQPPRQQLPAITRKPQVIGFRSRPCKSWVIVDPKGQNTVRANLTGEELDFPDRLMISHATLLQRLRDGWQPSDDVVDGRSD